MFSAAGRIIGILQAKPKNHDASFKFSDEERDRLLQKIVCGFADWAVRAMGKDFERYLKEGEYNFLAGVFGHMFALRDAGAAKPEQLSKAFEKSEFRIPQSVPKRVVHLVHLARANREYQSARKRLEAIDSETKKVRSCHLDALSAALPGLPKRDLEKFVERGRKDSDMAARYALQFLPKGSRVGIAALKKYFKDFQTRETLRDALARSRYVK